MTTPEDSEERLRRDEPARTSPNRQAAHLLLPNAGESVEAGVNTAYEVYGKYLRRGQEAAQKQKAREQDGQMNDRRNPWTFSEAPLGAGLTAIPLQLFRAWAQLAGTWAELSMIPGAAESVRQMSKLVDEFWTSAGVTSNDAKPDAESKSKEQASHASIRVAVELSSAQPVELEIEFNPPSGVVPIIQRLHPLRGDAPPLSALEFTFDPASDRAKLSLAVPATQAPGRYTGTIFDDRDDRACGTVRVRVGE
jgi:hypothetical protein